jgi:hypothetical protein
MLVNSSVVKDRYGCNIFVKDYLVYKYQLPLLGLEKNTYYFARTHALEEALKKMPLYLKISMLFWK